MKKIVLVPLLTISLLAGCNGVGYQPEVITLDQWLANADDTKECEGYYRLYKGDFERIDTGYDNYDYDNYVLKAIKESAEQATRKNKKIKETGDTFFTYTLILDKPLKYNVLGCSIFVYENHIMTFTDFYMGNKYVEQRCYYEYDTTVGKKLIDTTLARANEVKDTREEEKRFAEEQATIENFLVKAEEATTFSITYNNKSVEDENRSFLNALKGKEYRDNTDGTYTLYDSEVLATYQIDEHLLLRLGTENRGSNFNGERGNIVEVCYNYKPTFIPSAYYEEGKYGPRQRYAISQETHSELKQVLDSLVTE